MDERVDSSLPFDLNTSGLPQLRSDLSASLLSPLSNDLASGDPEDSISAVVAAATGVPRNLDSIGNLSPHRTRSIRDHEVQISDLKKENFSLKLRIFFLEERAKTIQDGDEEDGGFQLNIDLQVQVAQLKNENHDKQMLLQRAAAAIDTLTSRNEELLDQQKDVGDVRTQFAELKDELEQSRQECRHYHDQYQQVKSEVDTLQGIQSDHATLQHRLDGVLRQTAAEKDKLESQLHQLASELQAARTSLAASEKSQEEIEAAHAASSGVAGQVPQLKSELEARGATIKKLDGELKAAMSKHEAAVKERDDIQAAGSKKALELQLEVRTRDARISDLEAEVAHHQELLKGVEANLKASHGSSVDRAVHHYEELMAQQAADLAGTRDKLLAVQKQVTQKEAQVASLENQLALSSAEVETKDDALHAAASNVQKNVDLVKDLTGQLKKRSSEIAELRRELADTQERLDDLEKEGEMQSDKDAAERASKLRSLTREVEKLRALVDQERQSKGLLQDNLQALKDALAGKEQALQNVRSQVEHSGQLHRQRQSRLEQQYQDQLESLRRDLSRRDSMAERLSAALREKEDAMKDLTEITSCLSSGGPSSGHRDLHVRQLTTQIMDLRRKLESLMKEKEEDAEEFEKQIQQLRKRNTKLQREVKDAQENLQQSKKLNKRIEEANESRENLLDALNRSFTSEAGDETASDLMQSELAARDAEILSLTGQLHEKEKELQVLMADYDRIQKSHSDLLQQLQDSLLQKDSTIEQLLKAGREKDEQLLQLTENSMTRSGQNALSKSQLDELREANAKLESMARSRETQLQSFQVAAQAKDGVIKSLQEQLQMQRGRVSMSPSKRPAGSVEADLLATQAQLRASQELVDATRRQLGETQREKESAQKQLDAIAQEAMSLVSDTVGTGRPASHGDRAGREDAEAARLRSELADAENQVAALRGQLTDAQRWNDALQSRLDTEKLAAGQVNQLTEKLRKAEADLNRARVSADELRDELQQRNSQQEDLTRLQAQLRAAHAERDLLQRQLDTAKRASSSVPPTSPTKLLDSKRELAQLQEAKQKLQADLLHANDDVRVVTAEKASLQNSLQKAHGDLQARQQQVERLELEVERLRGELQAARSSQADQKSRADAARKEADQVSQQLRLLQDNLNASNMALQRAQSEVSALQTRLSTSQAEERRLAAANEGLKADASKHAHAVTALQQEIAKLRDSLSAAQLERDGLRQQLQQSERDLKDARGRLQHLQSSISQDKSRSFLKPGRSRYDPSSDVDQSGLSSPADSLPDLSIRHAAETARLRQELDVMRALVDRLSSERSDLEARCAELARQLTHRAPGAGPQSPDNTAIRLDRDLLQQFLRSRQANAELRQELCRLLAQAGFSPSDTTRFFPEQLPGEELEGLRKRYADGVHANEQLREQLQSQLAACESDRRSWQERNEQLDRMRSDLLQQTKETPQRPATDRHDVDMTGTSGLTLEDLHGLCKDLSQSLRASQALQTDLGHSLTSKGTPAPSYLEHEKERLVSDVATLQERLASLQAENAELQSRLASSPSAGTSPARLTELERELQQSHAIASRLRGTLASQDRTSTSSTSQSGHTEREALAPQLSALRHVLQQHAQASEALREQISQQQQQQSQQLGTAAASSHPSSPGTSTAMASAATGNAAGAFLHMEGQVRNGLESLARLESAIATAATGPVDGSTVQHLLQLARQLRAQLEAAEALLSQLKHVSPTSVSASVENELLKAELAQLRAKLASHEKIMRKAVLHIQKSKSDKSKPSDLLDHLRHANNNMQRSKQDLEAFMGRHKT